MMAWIDKIAAMTAQRHAEAHVVTASIDQISFLAPVFVGDHVILKSRIEYVGKTSMEIKVEVETVNPVKGTHKKTTQAYLTFVALGADGRPAPVPPLKLESEAEETLFEKAKKRIAARKALAKTLALGLSFLAPLGLLAPQAALAEKSTYDLSAGAGIRSYPLGAAAYVQGGKHMLLWGDTSNPLNYGYSRVGGRLQSSGKVNKGEVEVSVSPVSISKIYLNFGGSARNLTDIQTLDCETLECSSSIMRTTLGGELTAGWSGFFARGAFKTQWLDPSNATAAFADESTNLALAVGGDRINTWDFVGGYQISENWRSFFRWEHNRTVTSDQYSLHRTLFASRSFGKWNAVVGAGLFKSSTSQLHGQVAFAFQYTWSKGLEL